nr:divergent polysaccharide deacetylase family protein [uncultured Holophaga sp.]
MVRKKKGSTSTGKLMALAVTMLLVGLGLGLALSSHGCDRKPRPGSKELEPGPLKPDHKRKHPAEVEPPERKLPGEAETRPEPEPKRGPETGPKTPPIREPESTPPPRALPRFALIIDDLGYAKPELVTRLCSEPIPFAVAVLPFQEFTHQSAEIAHAKGKEVMLHLPMEPLGYPGPSRNPGPGAVFHTQSEAEVKDTVRKALAAIPFRKGVNNHMGSRITPDRERMGWVMAEVKQAGCFFVDSRTEKNTVALDVAQKLGVPAVQRKVFLDDDKSFSEMKKQWDRALALARKDGHVVIIGHIYPETVAALEKLVPASREQVKFVNVSELTQ